jgi:hypothetical protein
MNVATRKKHPPEHVVRKLATADREPPPRHVHDAPAASWRLLWPLTKPSSGPAGTAARS